MRPTDISCKLATVGFNGAVAILYAPLFIKTNRLYRIFSAGKSGRIGPPPMR